MGNTKSMSEEDFLKKHLETSDKKNIEVPTNLEKDNNTISDLQFFSIDVKDLPCGRFYPIGTTLMVRPAIIKEIQAYSMVDNNNFHDIIDKMNNMLQSCVRVKYPDGNVKSYLDVKDQDRLYVIFLIRELTFQQGNSLEVNAKGPNGENCKIELVRKNFRFHETESKVEKYYNKSKGAFIFETKNNKTFEITPPTIGLQKSFTDYIIKENSENNSPNLSFLKVIPYLLGGRSGITIEGIKAKLHDYEQIDDISFQFLNAVIDKMSFGIKELVKEIDGQEVRAEMQFPNGASGIFVISDAFEAFIKE